VEARVEASDQLHFDYFGSKPGVNGWFRKAEGEMYARLASDIYNGVIVEVGVYEGLSLSYIIEPCRNNRNTIYAVDYIYRKELKDNIAKWNAEKFTQMLTMPSVEAAKLFANDYLDMVFIDASHHYLDVKSDITAWLPKVKKDGILAGHDWQNNWPGVDQAVEELLPASMYERSFTQSFWAVKRLARKDSNISLP
jgi:predicted O-methyltransferase YrrM